MKKIVPFFSLLIISFAFFSCETTEITEVTEVTEVIEAEPNILFEQQGINFTAENDFSTLISFPNNFEIRDTDLVIAYRLTGRVEGSNTDIWEPLPQTIFLDGGGTVLYTFNYSETGIGVFLDVEDGVDRLTLPDDLIFDQVFQFAILPSQLNSNATNNILSSDLSYDKVAKNATFITVE